MSFKEILKNTDNQILKGVILKVKNESMKKDIKFSDLRKNLLELMEYDEKVFFDVIKLGSDQMMIDLSVKKLGLRDLLDSEFAGKGLE